MSSGFATVFASVWLSSQPAARARYPFDTLSIMAERREDFRDYTFLFATVALSLAVGVPQATTSYFFALSWLRVTSVSSLCEASSHQLIHSTQLESTAQ